MGGDGMEPLAGRGHYKLEAWKLSRKLVTEIYKLTKNFPKEEMFGLYSKKRLLMFAGDVEKQRIDLLDILFRIKKKGKRIVGISASAKGSTLLNYCNIGRTFLDFITEKSELKIGRYTPGTHIPIFNDSKIFEERPEQADNAQEDHYRRQ